MNKCYTTIHTNWNGTLGHNSSVASPLKHDFLGETLFERDVSAQSHYILSNICTFRFTCTFLHFAP